MKKRKDPSELEQKYQDRRVVLVDEGGRESSEAGIIEAHRDGGLKHRAFSLVLYRPTSSVTSLGVKSVEILLQQRAQEKPVFPFFWANTCCYNMAPGEEIITRASSRVKEEMGIEFEPSELRELYTFSYEATDLEGWCENEYDHVIVGEYSGDIELNPEEAMDYRWVEWEELKNEIQEKEEIYAPWFKLIVEDGRLENFLRNVIN